MLSRMIFAVCSAMAIGAHALDAAAFTNEPDGFGQHVWGEKYRAVEFQKCVAIENAPMSKLCWPHESGTVRIVDSEIPLSNLTYGFWQDRLESVEFRGDGSRILQGLKQGFGAPGTADTFKSGGSYEWVGSDTRILVVCDSDPNLCTVTLRSTRLLQEQAKADRERSTKN